MPETIKGLSTYTKDMYIFSYKHTHTHIYIHIHAYIHINILYIYKEELDDILGTHHPRAAQYGS